MRKLLALAVLVCAFGGQVGAPAEELWTIQVGNPETALFYGISDLGSACQPGGELDGIDGRWFPTSGGIRIEAHLEMGATGLEDLDVYFYDSECLPIGEGLATQNSSEIGTSPAGAMFLIVDLFSGADARFKLFQG